MSTDEYVPDEQDLEVAWIESEASADDINVASAEFDRFLARVRRDAAREALDGYAAAEEASFLDLHVKGAVMSAAACQHAKFAATEYRDTHYPETEDQT